MKKWVGVGGRREQKRRMVVSRSVRWRNAFDLAWVRCGIPASDRVICEPSPFFEALERRNCPPPSPSN